MTTETPAADLPARLRTALTERFTALTNPFSEMRTHEKGPDGWPASHPVGPDQVAEVLRELMATEQPCGAQTPATYFGEVLHCVLPTGHDRQCQSATEYPYVSWPNPGTGQAGAEVAPTVDRATVLRARFEALAADWEQRGEYGDVSLTWGARGIRAVLAAEPAGRRLTPSEHDRAWHAIEGSAGEEGADPGTVLNAVLHALRIDPPTVAEEQVASPSRRLADEAQQPTPAKHEPVHLRWGLDDVMYGDDDTTTVMLSGPNGEPYWLELDAERSTVLRDCLAAAPTAAEETAR